MDVLVYTRLIAVYNVTGATLRHSQALCNGALCKTQQRQTGRLKRGRRDDSEAEDAELADELDDLGDQPRRNMSGDDMSEAEEGLFGVWLSWSNALLFDDEHRLTRVSTSRG
jgi:hypothetical protein